MTAHHPLFLNWRGCATIGNIEVDNEARVWINLIFNSQHWMVQTDHRKVASLLLGAQLSVPLWRFVLRPRMRKSVQRRQMWKLVGLLLRCAQRRRLETRMNADAMRLSLPHRPKCPSIQTHRRREAYQQLVQIIADFNLGKPKAKALDSR